MKQRTITITCLVAVLSMAVFAIGAEAQTKPQKSRWRVVVQVAG